MSTDALELVADNFDALGNVLDGISEVVADFDDLECGVIRVQLDDLLTKVRGAIGAVDMRLVALLDVGQSLAVPGGGQVVIEAKGRETCNGAKLARHLAARIADTPANEDGEPFPPGVLCERTANEIVECFGLDTASTKFRSTALKARGMRASEFRTFEDGEPKARFMR